MKKKLSRGLPAKQAEKAADQIVDKLLARDAAEKRYWKVDVDAAMKRLRTVTNVEIDAHPLLDAGQRQVCKELRNLAKRQGDEFTMLHFAEVSLRASGNDYAAVTDEGGRQAAHADAVHRRAAMLYVYEALKYNLIDIAQDDMIAGTHAVIDIVLRARKASL